MEPFSVQINSLLIVLWLLQVLYVWHWELGFDDIWIHCSVQSPIPATFLKSPEKWGCLNDNVCSCVVAQQIIGFSYLAEKFVVVVKMFDVYPAEIVNRNAKCSLENLRRYASKAKRFIVKSYCCFGPSFLWQGDFDGLNWIFLLFPFHIILDFHMFRLKTIYNKINCL